jgi:hypothetical protein
VYVGLDVWFVRGFAGTNAFLMGCCVQSQKRENKHQAQIAVTQKICDLLLVFVCVLFCVFVLLFFPKRKNLLAANPECEFHFCRKLSFLLWPLFGEFENWSSKRIAYQMSDFFSTKFRFLHGCNRRASSVCAIIMVLGVRVVRCIARRLVYFYSHQGYCCKNNSFDWEI